MIHTSTCMCIMYAYVYNCYVECVIYTILIELVPGVVLFVGIDVDDDDVDSPVPDIILDCDCDDISEAC